MVILETWLNEGRESHILPLFTKQMLADRWGVNRQTVQNWSVRHDDFCKPLEQIVMGELSYFPLYEVERYERAKGLSVDD